MLAFIHAFIQHGGTNSLYSLPDLISEKFATKVLDSQKLLLSPCKNVVQIRNEGQLIYFLRIVVPYLQRISDKEKFRHSKREIAREKCTLYSVDYGIVLVNEYLKLVVAIYNILGSLLEKVNGHLEYEDTLCDLLYQFKYMFVGNSLKQETEQAIEKFPLSMREKLKFLHSSASDSSATAAALQSINIASIQRHYHQQLEQHQQMQQQLQQQASVAQQAQIQNVLQHLSSSGLLNVANFPPSQPPFNIPPSFSGLGAAESTGSSDDAGQAARISEEGRTAPTSDSRASQEFSSNQVSMMLSAANHSHPPQPPPYAQQGAPPTSMMSNIPLTQANSLPGSAPQSAGILTAAQPHPYQQMMGQGNPQSQSLPIHLNQPHSFIPVTSSGGNIQSVMGMPPFPPQQAHMLPQDIANMQAHQFRLQQQHLAAGMRPPGAGGGHFGGLPPGHPGHMM